MDAVSWTVWVATSRIEREITPVFVELLAAPLVRFQVGDREQLIHDPKVPETAEPETCVALTS
jgi:hypothetical protein